MVKLTRAILSLLHAVQLSLATHGGSLVDQAMDNVAKFRAWSKEFKKDMKASLQWLEAADVRELRHAIMNVIPGSLFLYVYRSQKCDLVEKAYSRARTKKDRDALDTELGKITSRGWSLSSCDKVVTFRGQEVVLKPRNITHRIGGTSYYRFLVQDENGKRYAATVWTEKFRTPQEEALLHKKHKTWNRISKFAQVFGEVGLQFMLRASVTAFAFQQSAACHAEGCDPSGDPTTCRVPNEYRDTPPLYPRATRTVIRPGPIGCGSVTIWYT